MSKVLEKWWGIDALLESMAGCSKEEQEAAIVAMLLEDPPALIDGMVFEFTKDKEE